jgi:glycosyltransferase involved in cell wall biosynthesis
VRILIVTAQLPYPTASGGAIRVDGLLRGLHQAKHTVHVLCYGTGDTRTPLHEFCAITQLPAPQRRLLDRLKTLFLSCQPDIALRFYDEAFLQEIITLNQKHPFDVIQFEGIEMACFIAPLRQKNISAKLVFDTFNAEAELQKVIFEIERQNPKRLPQAIYSWLQSRRIATYEAMLCQIADAVIAVSQEDAQFLQTYIPDKRVYIVSSGIHVVDYTNQTIRQDLGENALVFTGKMDYRPNIDAMMWFCGHILPRLPQAHLTIVGQKPTPSIQALTTQHPVTITGWVQNVTPYLRGASVYVAPLRMGSGTRLKILEALACGCAIVATHLAASGLHADVLNAMRLADSEEAFANAVLELLNDTTQRNQLGAKAVQAVTQHYDWSAIMPHLWAVYEDLGIG